MQSTGQKNSQLQDEMDDSLSPEQKAKERTLQDVSRQISLVSQFCFSLKMIYQKALDVAKLAVDYGFDQLVWDEESWSAGIFFRKH